MKVIILGGAGFIGSHLTDFLLKKKYKITVIDNLSTGRINNIKHIKKKIKPNIIPITNNPINIFS